MADHIKLTVLKNLTTLLEGINPDATDGEYTFDLRNAVFRGRTVLGDEVPETCVTLLEAPQQDFGQFTANSNARKAEFLILLQGWTRDDKTHPSDPVYALALEIEERLGRITAEGANGQPRYPALYRLGNTIAEINFPSGIVRPPVDGVSKRAFVYMPIRVGIARSVR